MIPERDAMNREWEARAFTDDVVQEYVRARQKHRIPFHNAHEGYAVLLEEVEEVWEEVKHRTTQEHFYEELVQVAAMALALALECAIKP